MNAIVLRKTEINLLDKFELKTEQSICSNENIDVNHNIRLKKIATFMASCVISSEDNCLPKLGYKILIMNISF